MKFNERLKESREWAGFSQVAAAKAIGVARQTYLDLESGKTEPRISTVASLASLFNVDPTYLAWGNASDSWAKLEAIKEILK